MQQRNWGNWLQVVSNLAVLAGVILVVLQLRQNAELQELQILKQDTDVYAQIGLALLEGDYPRVWAKMVEEPENLTLEETRILEAEVWSNVIYRWLGLYRLYERGLLERSAWTVPIEQDLEFDLAHPYGRMFWHFSRDLDGMPEEFVKYVDERLAVAPFNFLKEKHEVEMEMIRKIQAEHEAELANP